MFISPLWRILKHMSHQYQHNRVKLKKKKIGTCEATLGRPLHRASAQVGKWTARANGRNCAEENFLCFLHFRPF